MEADGALDEAPDGDHEEHKEARENEDAGDGFAPEEEGGTEDDHGEGDDGGAGIDHADGGDEKADAGDEEEDAEVAGLFGGGAEGIAMVPEEESDDGEDEPGMFLIIFGVPGATGPEGGGFEAISEGVIEAEEIDHRGGGGEEEEGFDGVSGHPAGEEAEGLRESQGWG